MASGIIKVGYSTVYTFTHSFSFLRPSNKEELFNLHHASARNVIERIFGVIKRRFRILLLPPKYSIEVQAFIPVALSVLHNLIKFHSQNQDNDSVQDWTSAVEQGDVRGGEASEGGGINEPEDGTGPVEEDVVEDELPSLDQLSVKAIRDAISEVMWDNYQRYLRDQGET